MPGIDPFEEQIQQNRIARNNRIYERQQIARRQQSPQGYVGYDAATGLHRLRGAEGDRLVPSVTTGGLESGAIVRSGPGSVDGLQAAQPFIFDEAPIFIRPTFTAIVADQGNAAIRLVEIPSGKVSTLAGIGRVPNNATEAADGPVEGRPIGSALSAFNIGETYFFAERGQASRIRKIEAGEITTIAGDWFNPGDVDGVFPNTRLKSPEYISVAWDSQIALTTRFEFEDRDKIKLLNPITTELITIAELGLNERSFGLTFDDISGLLFCAASNKIYSLDSSYNLEVFIDSGSPDIGYNGMGCIVGRRLVVPFNDRTTSPGTYGLTSFNILTKEERKIFQTTDLAPLQGAPNSVVFANNTYYVTAIFHRVMKVKATPTDFVGTMTPGFVDGVGVNARLNNPFQIILKT